MCKGHELDQVQPEGLVTGLQNETEITPVHTCCLVNVHTLHGYLKTGHMLRVRVVLKYF